MKNAKFLAKSVAEKDSQIAGLMAENARLNQQLEWLVQQIWLSKHRQFGASSEKSGYDLPRLFNGAEVVADANVPEPGLIEIQRHYRNRVRLVNDDLPENLPVEVVVHELDVAEQVCPECGGGLHVMGRETRRELVIIPAHAKIVEHVRNTYSCRGCEKNSIGGVPVIKAPIDEPVIKSSFASPEAIAHIMTQKFVMGSPLYRQEQEWQRNGIMLSRQTMSNWIVKATEDWLAPIYNALKALLLAFSVIHADETTLQVLQEPGKLPQSESYMWLYRTSGFDPCGAEVEHPIVLYEYQPDRCARHPAAFLKGFKGYCHADGYDGYHGLPADIIVAGCWSHARRKWDEALKALPKENREGSNVLRGKRYCDRLFELERKFADLTPEERYAKRQELAKPLVDEFFTWIVSLNALPKSALGVAANYALGQRKYLERYLEDGRLEISNNRAERSIKPFVIDRKNFLFCKNPRGATASAIMFSLIETAKENGLNPFAYLTYVFKTAPNLDLHNNPDALERLLPHYAPDSCKAGKIS